MKILSSAFIARSSSSSLHKSFDKDSKSNDNVVDSDRLSELSDDDQDWEDEYSVEGLHQDEQIER